MFRLWALVGAVLFGGILGGMLTYRPGTQAQGHPTERGTREICQAVVAGDTARLEALYRRYAPRNASGKGRPDPSPAIQAAQRLSELFEPNDPIGAPRRTGEEVTNKGKCVAVSCTVGPAERVRTVTISWRREPGKRWKPYSLAVSPLPGEEEPIQLGEGADPVEETGTPEAPKANVFSGEMIEVPRER
jgi:hypothetical protein